MASGASVASAIRSPEATALQQVDFSLMLRVLATSCMANSNRRIQRSFWPRMRPDRLVSSTMAQRERSLFGLQLNILVSAHRHFSNSKTQIHNIPVQDPHNSSAFMCTVCLFCAEFTDPHILIYRQLWTKFFLLHQKFSPSTCPSRRPFKTFARVGSTYAAQAEVD